MKCKAEEPTGHPLMSTPLIFELGKLCESMRKYDAFIVTQSASLPQDSPASLTPERLNVQFRLPGRYILVLAPYFFSAGWIEYAVDYAQNVGKREAVEIGREWESCNVSLADILEDP